MLIICYFSLTHLRSMASGSTPTIEILSITMTICFGLAISWVIISSV